MGNINFENLKIDEHVKFGKYWQGESESEGKTPIEWIVASNCAKEVLLISLFCIDRKKFDENNTPNWKDSTIRKWLNGDFFNEAFNDDEKEFIVESEILNNNLLVEDVKEKTLDKVFLLSVEEIIKYFNTNESRMAAATKYAITHNAYRDSNYKTKEGNPTCYWWTRSIGNHFSHSHVAGINYFGYIGASGNLPNANNFAIRPALWIKR